MTEFIPGQRWISDAELDMGLGTVLTTDHRSVTIVFLATGETRIYAKESAPLTRAQFNPGDSVTSHDGTQLKVVDTKEMDGLLTYHGIDKDGNPIELEEGQLDNFIQLSRPSDRLLTGQIDHAKWFELRYESLIQKNNLAQSDLRGLTGARTSLIPHQLYIAHEVASRYAPRVLLADEVGLGKTIEAGLILHQQLLTERARRVLIVVPESLVHQWLVEMLRRFNLHFSIFDEDRCLADDESSAQENPFENEQLILCSLEFLSQNNKRAEQAAAGEWDLLVVDEAHHLAWSPEQSSPEYDLIANLSATTKGVLLLTATPEQLGKASHFARLRLLDPARFPDFDSFVEEEKHYEPVAQAVEELLNKKKITKRSMKTLQTTIDEQDNQALLDVLQDSKSNEADIAAAKLSLVEHLLDRHGTGRVLYRNTRSAVKGFPERNLNAYALPLPEQYATQLIEFQTAGMSEPQLLLCPELLYQVDSINSSPWTDIDPRLDWLIETLKELKPAKVLVITASAQSVLDIAEAMRVKAGINAAVFHEGLNIVERDRAAAFFADNDYGSQVLVCSEIGSEGRNFQFAHHLVLFDLPLNPDLLEQRIGRLDRIGQTETIQIHVPYLENSPQDTMYTWYHEGLNAFEHTCPAGHSVFSKIRETLVDALHQTDSQSEDLPALIETSKQLHDQLNQALQQGRDRLLEHNSYRPLVAQDIKQRALQQDEDFALRDYLESVFDCYGIDMEYDTENSLILRPSQYMQTSSFPGLLDEGMTVSFDRDTALSNEDMHYITWDHPLLCGSLDLVLTNEQGNTSVIAIKTAGVKPGTILLESIFVLEPIGNSKLQSSRYLPPTTIRIVVDQFGKSYENKLSHDLINQTQITVDAETSKKVVRSHLPVLRKLISSSEELALKQAPKILKQAHQHTIEALTIEIDRLIALKQVNPNVREEEVEYFRTQLSSLTEVLKSARPRLDSVRVLAAT